MSLRVWAAAFGAIAAAAALQVAAETRWISDVLTVPLRSGPSTAHRILHRGLPSGTPLEVLRHDEDAGFTQVRTRSGLEGWLPTQFLVREPIARDRLGRAEERAAALEQQVAELTSKLRDARSVGAESMDTSEDLARETELLRAELADLKRLSSSAIELNREKEALAELNERLREEVDDLVAENRRLGDNLQERWMLIGGGLALAGLIAGMVLKSRPRRSGWS